jgi:hypothetical protein
MQDANALPSSGSLGGAKIHPLVPGAKPKLLEQFREAIRVRHYSRRTEDIYCIWVKRFILFHHVRLPAELAEPEINAFLTHRLADPSNQESTTSGKAGGLKYVNRSKRW